MLEEYFSLVLGEVGGPCRSGTAGLRNSRGARLGQDGHLETLPCLLEGHLPCFAHLPLFCLRLAVEVEWESEKECFLTIAKELGYDFEASRTAASRRRASCSLIAAARGGGRTRRRFYQVYEQERLRTTLLDDSFQVPLLCSYQTQGRRRHAWAYRVDGGCPGASRRGGRAGF
jgi:hypothetical protein